MLKDQDAKLNFMGDAVLGPVLAPKTLAFPLIFSPKTLFLFPKSSFFIPKGPPPSSSSLSLSCNPTASHLSPKSLCTSRGCSGDPKPQIPACLIYINIYFLKKEIKKKNNKNTRWKRHKQLNTRCGIQVAVPAHAKARRALGFKNNKLKLGLVSAARSRD